MRVNGSGGPFRPPSAETSSSKPATSKEAPATARNSEGLTRQTSVSGDGFEASRAGRATGPAARPLPTEVRTPSTDPFRRSLEKLASLGAKDLQPAGLAWRDRAVKGLQDAVEQKRTADPAGFAQLERDPEAFKKFTSEALSQACVQAGVLNLSAQDQVKLATTPELRDLLGKDGVKQIAAQIGKLKPEDVARLGGKTAETLGRAGDELRKTLKLPKLDLPRLPVPSLRAAS